MKLSTIKLEDTIGTSGLFKDGDWVESKDQDSNGDIRLIQLADIGIGVFKNKSNKSMNREKFTLLNCTELIPGDILIARMPDPIGRACIFPGDKKKCATIVDISILRVDPNVAYNRYVMHYINTGQTRSAIENYVSGTTRKRISRTNLGKINIKLPPIDEQKRIADKLDLAEQLVSMRQASIEKLDLFAKSIFLNMFGDPIQNEKNWDIIKLEKLSEKILSGNTPKGGDKVYVKDGVLFLRSQNVWRNSLVLDDVAYITEETHKKMRNSSLKHKDLLMTKTGRVNTENSSLGRAAIYLGEDNRANINGHVYLIRLKENVIPEFILFILTTSEYRDYIRKTCVGGIDKRQLNKVHLENFPIIFPPIEKQKEFVTILRKSYEQEKLMEKSLFQMEALYDSTVQEVFVEVGA